MRFFKLFLLLSASIVFQTNNLVAAVAQQSCESKKQKDLEDCFTKRTEENNNCESVNRDCISQCITYGCVLACDYAGDACRNLAQDNYFSCQWVAEQKYQKCLKSLIKDISSPPGTSANE